MPSFSWYCRATTLLRSPGLSACVSAGNGINLGPPRFVAHANCGYDVTYLVVHVAGTQVSDSRRREHMSHRRLSPDRRWRLREETDLHKNSVCKRANHSFATLLPLPNCTSAHGNWEYIVGLIYSCQGQLLLNPFRPSLFRF